MHFVDAFDFTFVKTATDAQKAKVIATTADKLSGVAGDDLLYLGPVAGLTQTQYYLICAWMQTSARRLAGGY
jgi:hypothetical protein